MSDTIADLLTRIRNAHRANHDQVLVQHSRLNGEITRVLKQEGYIRDFELTSEGNRKLCRITLKYTGDRKPAIQGIRRMSKPGLRNYVTSRDVPRVLDGMGIAILSTSSGILTDKEARDRKVGGELLCKVW
jgi:small subunit ribosomal protein S8